MRIHTDFIGGNISIKDRCGTHITLENELRDSTEDWFYWAFCVEGAAGQTLTFHFQKHRLGYFGPAVSHDLVHWHWLGTGDVDAFTYRFSETEDRVYFAHSLLYHPARFAAFAAEHGLQGRTLCRGWRGTDVPCYEIGSGAIGVLLTARHHACESTGSYVLEGFLEEWLKHPPENVKIFCVPFVDYDGVVRGDQGKMRAPHDHNRDYGTNASIYPECAAIRDYIDRNGCRYAFDFHSPWHFGGQNDTVFIVQNSEQKLDRLNRFGELLQRSLTDDAMTYRHENDYPPETGWNKKSQNCSRYASDRAENEIAFSLETPYFGTPTDATSESRFLALGRCFAVALKAYIGACDPEKKQ